MPRRFYKHKLLLDEGFYLRTRLPIANHRFDLKHVAADYHRAAISDQEVYDLACSENRLVVTFNVKDFTQLAVSSSESGVIGVSPNLPIDQVDKKLTALLVRASEKSLFGRLTLITGESRSSRS